MEIFEVCRFMDQAGMWTGKPEDAAIAVGVLDDNGLAFPVPLERLPDDVKPGDRFHFVEGRSILKRAR